ncbi:MAG TPA: FAD-dependent oxidoreductase, partial [Anaerolineales bacterium]|nr:FAD-dependent oxidoreductase [Anaerolineales bacterium]
MANEQSSTHPVAVIGAGPAGIYAARQLASAGNPVALINRDIMPGGLAEYGIFHNKYRMKLGLRKQFNRILEDSNIQYYGNVKVNQKSDLNLDALRRMGFKGIVVAVGAQGTKWLGLPGEDLNGVYHAKDLVFHYNQLPPFSQKEFRIGNRVVLIGAGNVMADVANYCINDLHVKHVTTVVRRGPADVKFEKKEFATIANYLDQEALDREIERVRPILEGVNQDATGAKAFILSALFEAKESGSDSVFNFHFLATPRAVVGDEDGNVAGLQIEHTTLSARADGRTSAEGLGTTEVIPADTVIFCIGDRVSASFGLPLDRWNEYAKNPEPRFPISGISYEAYDEVNMQPIEDVFLVGWAREASSGLVGTARKDGEQGAAAVLDYLETLVE